MTHSITSKYKGIAIFGAPGTGKTTVARLLLSEIPESNYIETSHCVIYPAMAMKDHLPKEKRAFIRMLADRYGARMSFHAARNDARAFSVYLKRAYAPSIIAETLEAIHRNKFSKKFAVIAGTRGYANALRLKKRGYFVAYLETGGSHATRRVARRDRLSTAAARKERMIEERIFSTSNVKKIAHISFDTGALPKERIVADIMAHTFPRECARCVNSNVNPACHIGKSGLCDICERYARDFAKAPLKKEKRFLESLKGSGRGAYDALVGISGGKDSTAVLYEVKKMGFRPLAFSLDTGYYPRHIFPRARRVAEQLSVPYKKINARKYMRLSDVESFRKTAALYGEKESDALREKFRTWYAEDRRHYSIKCAHALPFVRTCQLCRRMIIRAYYGEAIAHGVRLVILGINEWAGLSQNTSSKKFVFSAIRELKPFAHKPSVYVVHLPFLLGKTSKDTRTILKKIGWKIPQGESFIESNSNSCLFARAAESKARRMLGFHPDATRLAREVTVGFITKKQAHAALKKTHRSRHSVHTVLKRAGIL